MTWLKQLVWIMCAICDIYDVDDYRTDSFRQKSQTVSMAINLGSATGKNDARRAKMRCRSHNSVNWIEWRKHLSVSNNIKMTASSKNAAKYTGHLRYGRITTLVKVIITRAAVWFLQSILLLIHSSTFKASYSGW